MFFRDIFDFDAIRKVKNENDIFSKLSGNDLQSA
jgi:hypothetical protein